MDPTRILSGHPASSIPEDVPQPGAPEVAGEPETLLNIASSEDTFKIQPAPAAEVCPRCGARLISPESLGMCEACGYCRSLAATSARPMTQPKPAGLKPAEWVGVVLGGLAAIALVSLIAGRCLATNSPQQMLWSTIQFSLGIVTVLGAQAWALVLVLPGDAALGLGDLFVPFRLWKRAVQRLPETRWPVSAATWGAGLAVFALVLIGHVSFLPAAYEREARLPDSRWYAFQPQRELREAMRNWAQNEDDTAWKSATEQLAGKPDLATKATETGANDDSRPAVQCVILGYVPQADGTPATLLLGTAEGGKIRYAGTARQGFPDSGGILYRLMPLQRREVPVPGAKGLKAIWVKPELLCEVQHSGVDSAGTLRDARVKTQ